MYSGNEHLTYGDRELPFSMLNFWQWAYSNLLDNADRGVFAEYIVKSALSINGPDVNQGFRWWHPYDLTGPSGLRIEVKCSGYLMYKEQVGDEGLAKITFNIAPTRLYNEYAEYSSETARHSDVFVFCVWTAKEYNISPLDMKYWDFYVLSTKVLDDQKKEQKSITFNSLIQMNPRKSDFYSLRKTIMLEYSERGPFTFPYKIRSMKEANTESSINDPITEI